MNGKKICKSLLGENISKENLFVFLSRIQRIMQTQGVHSAILSALVLDSKFNCTPLSLSQDYKFTNIGNSIFRKEEHSTAGQWLDTSWLKSRQLKFPHIDNNIFRKERSSTAVKFFEVFTP